MSEDNSEIIKLFNEKLIEYGGDRLKAAMAVYPNDMVKAVTLSKAGIEKKNTVAIVEEDEDIKLPSKAEHCKELYTIFKDVNYSLKERLVASHQFAEIQGTIQKPGTVVNNNIMQQKVMVVKDYGTNENWEEKLRIQQQKLVSGQWRQEAIETTDNS